VTSKAEMTSPRRHAELVSAPHKKGRRFA